MHTGKVLFEKDGITVIDCTVCGYAHVNPLPKQEDLDDFYDKKFYQDIKTSYFTDYERDQDWWKINYEELLDKYAQIQPAASGKKLLDIGSGPGLFLKVAEEKGFDAKGIEPSEDAFNYSRSKFNVNVEKTTVEQLDSTKQQFNFIHSALVLEHILDPLAFITKAVSMLADGGLLSIVVPNDFNPIQEINVQLGQKQWWVSPFEHLNYFNAASLRTLIEKTGLEVVYENVTFPIDLFLMMGKNYLSDPAQGKESHQMRKTFEFNFHNTGSVELKENLYQAFGKLGIGRELIIIARKKG